MEKINQDQVIANLKKCPHFERCNQNLCPLDLELSERSGGLGDKCRFMREQQKAKVAGKVIEFGGRLMPDCSLFLVPEGNLKWLNESSRARWKSLQENRDSP